MGQILGLLGILMASVTVVGAVLGARIVVGTRLGIRGLGFRPTAERRRGEPIPKGKQLTVVIACMLAAYLTPATIFTIARKGQGRVERQLTGPQTILVVPGHPADRAGLRDGDTIVAVAGEAVDAWGDLSHAVSSRPGEVVSVTVLNQDGRPPILVEVSLEGKIGVEAQLRRTPIGMGTALLKGLQAPARVAINLVVGLSDFLFGTIETELGGPVAIVRESSRAPARTVYDWLYLLGALTTYFGLPLGLVGSVVACPRREVAPDPSS